MASKTKKIPMTEHEKLQKNIALYLKRESEELENMNLNRQIVIVFPRRTTIPLMGRIAVKLLSWSGGVFDFYFTKK